jgi:hypothetical protein
MNNEKPWWAPDAQGFLAGAIVIICGVALFARMRSTSTVDDKMLDTMITILFSTCLVTVYNYSFGSSRGSQAKDETMNKIAESAAAPSATSPVVAAAAATAATIAAKVAAPAAAAEAAPPAAAEAAPPAVDAELERRGIPDNKPKE